MQSPLQLVQKFYGLGTLPSANTRRSGYTPLQGKKSCMCMHDTAWYASLNLRAQQDMHDHASIMRVSCLVIHLNVPKSCTLMHVYGSCKYPLHDHARIFYSTSHANQVKIYLYGSVMYPPPAPAKWLSTGRVCSFPWRPSPLYAGLVCSANTKTTSSM